MEIAPYINASFTPSAAPAGTTPADHLANGLYAYINADKDPELKKRADATFGRTVPFDNSETQAALIGRSFASHTGYRQNPVQFLRDNKLPIPPNWSGENAQLYTQIGQHIISKYKEHYNNEKIKRDKAIADAQKDITDSFNRLPEAIADSVLQADGITSHTALDKDLLQSLTKYNQGENVLTAQKRAALAWQYIAPAFENVDHLQDTNRRLLLDIANALSDEKGQLDPHALAAFVMLTDKKATELQSTNSEFWADFADKFQNFWRTTDDQIKKNGGLAYSNWRDAQGIMPERPAYYGDERVEKLYGYMNQAINTAISPSEKAEWYAKLLSEMGGLVGESIVPMAVGIAAGAALAPAGAFAAAVAGYGAGVAASAPSTINNAIGNAYIKGVINPELYGTLEGIGQAAAENIGGPATSLKLFTKTAGKLTNYAASRAAGSRFLANQYARTTLNYLTAGAFESATELAEEELGGYIGSKLNAFARSMGFEVSPQAYQLGETLKDMKSHEVAAIFGYSYTLGLFGVPANFRDARNFAKNTDNLLKAGHTAKTARDIQLKVFQTEDKIADIIANPSLTQEQKDAAIRKEEQSLATYQQEKFTSDILSDQNLRSRLQKEGRNLRDEIEVALDIENEADLQILKEHNILEAVVIPGEKYKVSIYEPGELQQDGTRAPGKITTQEWSRMQLSNWLMLQKDTRIEQDLRAFQSLLLTHAHAQSATVEETKTLFQNLGENRPLAALGELHKHGITPAFFQKAAHQALQLQLRHQQEGMTEQQAAQQPSPDFEGLSLGQVQSLATAASQRAEQEIATTGALQNITEDTSIEYGGINLLTADGTALIKYVAGRATILDMLEERFEADIKQRTRGNQTLLNQLAETLLHIQSHLPGNIQLLDPKKKGNYTKSDLVEAYSKIAIGAFLYNEKNLPINAAGHRLIQNIGRAVDTTRMFRTIGNAWLTYANSPEGKAHLEAGGQTIADIMQQAGFTFSNQLASARATAQQRTEVLQARQWQPAIEEELDALLEQADEESELADLNQQEAKEPITIPAEESITGKEITIEPESASEQETLVSPETSSLQIKLDRAHNRILSGTGNTSDYTLYLHYNPMTHAEAIQNGICTINQHGNPSAAYTIGRQRSIFKDGKYSHANGQQRDVLTGEVSIAHITHSPDVPQFKRNKAGRESDQSGVVYELPGEYRQHDPIHLWQRTDGTLVVISGRHRLAKAIQAGATYIPATVFPENAQRDTLWARMHDFEQNVLDNQASVADTAVYVAGTNPLNRKLTEKETQEFTRPGSNSELGTYIGLHGSDDLLYCLTRGFISPDYAHRIARLAPDDADVQQQAIGALVQDGKGIQEAENSANIYREIRDSQTGELMFESDQQEEAFNRFLAKYAANKIREIGRAQRPHKAAKSERTIREHEAAGIKFEDAAANRATLQQLTAEQEKWRHPRLHPECMEEARKAFDETDEAKQTYMDFDLFSDAPANFSIRAATPSTLERFTADPLGERIVHTVRTEARRYARVLGDKTPQEQAVNAIASAESIINAVDKYLHRPDKPVSRRHRNQLTKLRSIIEKYAQIIASGTPRSFKRISPAEQQELQAAIAEFEAAELDIAETDTALLIEDDKRMNKRTREARSREHHRAIVREAAKGRVYKVLAAMLDTAADALDDYLKDQLLTKLHRLTATVAIKRTPSKRLKGKMTAPMYRELEQAIQLMAYSTRQKEDAIDTILTAHETLAQAIAANEDNITRGNTLLIELAHQLEQDGTPVTAQTLTSALAAHEARVAIFADITSKNYEQTRTAANAIYHIIRYGRALWQQKHEAREAEIQTYLSHFLANTTAEQGKANAIRNMLEKFKWTDALSLNATMNAAQTLLALSSYEPLQPIIQQVLENYATASVARQKHLQEMRKQELYLYARILGIKPATQAGYSDKQLRHISDQFDTFYAENNQTIQTDITVTWQERNADGILETHTSDPLRLTKWEALNLILTYRQQDYQTNAQLHGYTDTVLDQLEKLIGTDLMDFGNGIQQALINDGTIAVYEEREGIPMRNNPLYWPGNININTLNTTREEPLVNPYHPAAGHDFLHTRVRHRNEIAHLNAFTVWRKAVADRANYIYSDPVTSHLESLLARQQFAGRLKTLIGEGLYRQLKATIAEIKNASWQETTLQDVNNTIVATAFASKSLAVLSGNPSSLVRQLSAVANAGLMPGLTPDKYLQYAIGLKQGQGHIGIRDILQLDSFTTRQRDNAYVNEMLAMGNDVKFSRLMDWAKTGMNAMDKLDLLANAFSAAIVYNHKYDELKNLGTLTEDQIKKQCENAVAVYTKLLAQPLNRTDKSALYWQLGNHALGRAVLFMSSESINKIGMLRANYIRMRNQGKNPAAALGILLGTMGITVGLTAAITEATLAILTGSLPDDDDNIAAWATALWLNASYGQYLGSLPLIGGVTDSFFSPYGGYFSGDFQIPGKDAWERGGKLVEMLTDNKTYTAAQWEKETTRFMRDFTAVLGFAGGAYSRWQLYSQAAAFAHSFTAALNFLYPIMRGVEAYSDRVPNRKRKPRRSKSKIEQWLTPDQK